MKTILASLLCVFFSACGSSNSAATTNYTGTYTGTETGVEGVTSINQSVTLTLAQDGSGNITGTLTNSSSTIGTVTGLANGGSGLSLFLDLATTCVGNYPCGVTSTSNKIINMTVSSSSAPCGTLSLSFAVTQ